MGLLDRMGLQQLVNGAVGRQKRQPGGQLKALMPQGTAIAQRGAAEGRFVNQVQTQTRSQRLARQITRPGAQQIPGAQAQVFRHQEKNPQQGA